MFELALSQQPASTIRHENKESSDDSSLQPSNVPVEVAGSLEQR